MLNKHEMELLSSLIGATVVSVGVAVDEILGETVCLVLSDTKGSRWILAPLEDDAGNGFGSFFLEKHL